VEVESSDTVLFLLEWVRRRDPWSGLGDAVRRAALPHGSGGSEAVGELENTRAPWGLQLTLPYEGKGRPGDTEGIPMGSEQGEHPLGTSMQWETSSQASGHGEERVQILLWKKPESCMSSLLKGWASIFIFT